MCIPQFFQKILRYIFLNVRNLIFRKKLDLFHKRKIKNRKKTHKIAGRQKGVDRLIPG